MTGCVCIFPDCNGPTDFVIDQGGDWTVTESLVDANGNPLNLIGASAVLQSRPYPGRPVPSINLSTGTSGITFNTVASTVTWTLPGAQTAELVPALNNPVGFRATDTLRFLAYYDLFVTLASGALGSYYHGKLILLLGISNIARTNGEIALPTFP